MAQGEQVHISTYPSVWPTKDPKVGGNYNLENAIRIRAGAHSFEAKCFNVVAAGYMDKAMREMLGGLDKEAGRILDDSPRGVSMILAPNGEPIGDALCRDEGILYADIDLAACVEPKQFHDVVGSYNRFDIFQLTVDRSANRPIAFAAEAGDEAAEPAEPALRQDDGADAPLRVLKIGG
jgi:aliphatic nitrilase